MKIPSSIYLQQKRPPALRGLFSLDRQIGVSHTIVEIVHGNGVVNGLHNFLFVPCAYARVSPNTSFIMRSVEYPSQERIKR